MASTSSGYDLDNTTYSPEGRLFQVEYANRAVALSSTSVGVRCSDGVVLGVQKLTPSVLLVPGTGRRVAAVETYAGCTFSGLAADARYLVDQMHREAENYKTYYGTPMPVSLLAQRLATYMHAHTVYAGYRPLGCAVGIGGYDENGPALHLVEPSGTAWGYKGFAVGKAATAAKNEVEKLPLEDFTVEQALVEVARIIHSIHDEAKDKTFELELFYVDQSRVYTQVVGERLATIEATAKQMIRDAEAAKQAAMEQ